MPFFRVLGLLFALALAACSSDGSDGGGSSGDVLRILITNDDGVQAPGIDAVVEALRDDANNDIVVCAPAEQQSSTGDMMTDTPPPLQATATTTASGYPATAVDGFPADSVIYALENLYPDRPPHVVLSGINDGQNVGDLMGVAVNISGTIGAAKTAACLGVPALASSQGEGESLDDEVEFDTGVVEVLAWLESNRAALLAGTATTDTITSINIPNCQAGGEIRGSVEVPLGTTNPNDYLINGPQDCTSTVEDIPNDVEAFFNGFTTTSDVPKNKNRTCEKLEE